MFRSPVIPWPTCRTAPATAVPQTSIPEADLPRAVVLVDGEHYPPVIVAALAQLRDRGVDPVAALFLGGTEKVESHGTAVDLGVPATWVPRGDAAHVDVRAAADILIPLIAQYDAALVVDFSDEPVLDPRRRLQLAAHVLLTGVPYSGADFMLTPPPRPRLSRRPTIAVIGTGKRTGKTAISGDIARRVQTLGRTPVVVAMGRGGPADPVVVPAGTPLGAAALLEVVERGGHAASDFYEDAITSGAATVGARRCGGGLAGAVGYTNAPAAIAAAERLPGDLLLLEGSGASVPPAHADATVLVVPADCDPEFLQGYLGPYRVLLADLVVVTMAESPRGSPERVAAVLETIRSISRRTPVISSVLRPVPLDQVSGERVFFATTAPAAVGASLVEALEDTYGCDVVATSSRLADRPGLRSDLYAAPAFDVLLVELKAAAVDVATRIAAQAGARVVFCDNRPSVVGTGGDAAPADADAVLQEAVAGLVELAEKRAAGST
ncbi:MAG: 2,3-diphosphoglycerate synthetase [Nitriliruptorales bacterium]|nr:2,3-diphosphoglycerate synthetase [Nitriliruptorales bacterium]